MPDKDNFGAVLQPAVYAWQNNDLGLKQDSVTAALRSSAGTSGFHEMNHPVVVQQPVPFTKAKRAQSMTDDETWVDGKVNPTLSLFDQGDTRATTAVVNMQGSKSNACISTDGSSFTLNAMHGHDVHAVAFTPGNLARGAGPSPNEKVAPTQRCDAGRGSGDQQTCVAFSSNMSVPDCQSDGTTPTMKCGGHGPTGNPPAVVIGAFKAGQGAKAGSIGYDEHVSPTLSAADSGTNRTLAVAHALRGEGFDASEDGTGRGTPLVPVAPTLTAHNDPSRSPQSSEVTQQVAAVHAASMTVRRLTPKECERLQAFPDDWTLIPWRGKPAEECPDGPRYKALGNSMAVNCMAWIGERIAAAEASHA